MQEEWEEDTPSRPSPTARCLPKQSALGVHRPINLFHPGVHGRLTCAHEPHDSAATKRRPRPLDRWLMTGWALSSEWVTDDISLSSDL